MNKNVSILILLCTVVLLVSCSSCNLVGYDPSLLDDTQKMLAQGDSYTYKHRLGGKNDETSYVLTFQRMYGTDTFFIVRSCQDATLQLTVASSVDTAKYKVVLIDDTEREITTLVAGSQEKEHTLSLVANGVYRIKAVGYKASGKVVIGWGSPTGVSFESFR